METVDEIVEIAGKKYVLRRVLTPEEDHDYCKTCKKVTGYWYTPNGNTYCSECNGDK